MRRLRGFGRLLRDNGLTLGFAAAFLLALAGQAVAGHAAYNNEQRDAGLQVVSLGSYVMTSDFAVDVTENWQSEYLQFFLYIYATVWLVQRGSPESKPVGRIGIESEKQQLIGAHARANSPRLARDTGWRGVWYSTSLGVVMAGLFVLSLLAQSVSGQSAFNERRLRQFQAPLSWREYVTSADFWDRALQNWQSELLAMVSMVILSVYLRQRGSPESKPVGASHEATGVEG